MTSSIYFQVIDHIDKTLIQVRCSLEDVADNLVCSQLARGEKEPNVVRSLCTTLHNTGASPEIVGTTMVGSLRKVIVKPECDIMKDVGRAMKEDAFESKFFSIGYSALIPVRLFCILAVLSLGC